MCSLVLDKKVVKFLLYAQSNGPGGQGQDPGQPRRVGQGDEVEPCAGELCRRNWKSQKSLGKNPGKLYDCTIRYLRDRLKFG